MALVTSSAAEEYGLGLGLTQKIVAAELTRVNKFKKTKKKKLTSVDIFLSIPFFIKVSLLLFSRITITS